MRNMDGFSIIELVVVLTLAAIILGLGAPSFAEFQRNNRISGAANDLLGVVQTARTEAIKRQSFVTVCASTNPGAVNAACDTNSFLGYIAFDDKNANCVRDPGEAVLRAGVKIDSPAGNPLNVTSNGRCIIFAATGFLTAPPAPLLSAKQTLFCDNRGAQVDPTSSVPDGPTFLYARGVGLTDTGRARVTRDSAEIGAWEVACP